MLIDLPPVREYSIADCQELFISKMNDDFDIDGFGSASKGDQQLNAPLDRGVRGALSDAEPFTYTSSSDSDTDVCFSDIDIPMGVRPGDGAEGPSVTVMSVSKKISEQDLALHSPGQLLGTPRDSSRRYEYPFPAHLQMGEIDMLDDGASSTATTPGLTPAEGSSLGLVSLAAVSGGIATRSTSLPMYLQRSAPFPVPIPAPAPIPVPVPVTSAMTSIAAANVSNALLAPLSQVPPIAGPSSAPALSTSPNSNSKFNPNPTTSTSPSTVITTHPKLSRFNPANAPVPPGLRGRGRTRKSASVSAPQGVSVMNTMSSASSSASVAAVPILVSVSAVPATTVGSL